MEGERSMQFREEELRARKTPAEAGTVEIGKKVVSEQKTMDVPVTREEVYVERHPVDRRPADRPVGEGGTIEVPVREERVEVEKQAVVYEEVEVGKRPVTGTERVTETVRREVPRVEREGEVTIRGWDEAGPDYRRDWEQRYATSGQRWEDVEPYQQYVHEMSANPRYRGRNWDEVEPELRTGYTDWARRQNYQYEESGWDRAKENLREAWGRTRTRV
jgi:uncharacterized protein (TIGR02271 family)